MYIYLDESGNLGFDFTKKESTNFFVVTLLIIKTPIANRHIQKAIERTIRTKFPKKKRAAVFELKGSKTNIKVKRYFYGLVEECNFEIFTLILNKRRVYDYLKGDKERLYNYIARLLIEKCPFHKAKERVVLVLDKSKNRKEIREFNRYLLLQLEGILPLNIPLEIYHLSSHENKGIQAADLFCWGIFRKFERKDMGWYQIFKKKIAFETIYLPNKKACEP